MVDARRVSVAARLPALVEAEPGLTTAQLAERLGCTTSSVALAGKQLGLRIEVRAVPGRKGTRGFWFPATSAPARVQPATPARAAETENDEGDAAAQLDAIDEWLNAVGVPEIGTTLERVVHALGRWRP